MAIDDVPWHLVERYCAGSCTPEERAALDAWVGDDRSRRLLVERMRAMLEDTESSPTDADIERAWTELSRKMSAPDFHPTAVQALVMVGAVAVALVGAAWVYFEHGRP